jgi:hypothetical protein
MRTGLIAKLRTQFCAARGAQGIVVESPQEAHWRFRGLGTESPVFFGVSRKKCACSFLNGRDVFSVALSLCHGVSVEKHDVF